MSIWIAILIAIINGISTLAPFGASGVSAFAQNLLLPNVTNYSRPGFCAMLNFGVAVVVAYKKRADIRKMLHEFKNSFKHEYAEGHIPANVFLVKLLILTALPAGAAFIILLVRGAAIEKLYEPQLLIAAAFVIQGVLLHFFGQSANAEALKETDFPIEFGGKRGGRWLKVLFFVALPNLLSVFPGFSGLAIVYMFTLLIGGTRSFAMKLSVYTFVLLSFLQEMFFVIFFIINRLHTNQFWPYLIAPIVSGIFAHFGYNYFVAHKNDLRRRGATKTLKLVNLAVGAVMLIIALITLKPAG
ncbi:MAG: hypothetical protein LBQ91_02195 [Oscillospiraceae bacterium]|jgi:undecaprenyl pyrophosphate phosphatase UppP|nr:hypothetical protein [Oscillospiraceae bacterium]